MSDTIRDDIQTTSDTIENDAELLADVERKKQDPAASDEDLQRLASHAEALARRISDTTRIEKKLVERAAKS